LRIVWHRESLIGVNGNTNANTNSDVTVLGLGAMGSALAEALLDGGHRVTVWNRTPGRAAPLVARGAAHAETAAGAVAASPLTLVCLLDYASVRDALALAESALAGRTLANLTNGTPAQARAMAAWAAGLGADYLDGGIMAIPPMIGHPGSLVLYSGSAAAFETHREALERLGAADFLDDDPGAAALYDIALLSGMYGMFGGFLHAVAMVGSTGAKTAEFTTARLVPWLTAMMAGLPEMARQIDAGETGTRAAGSNLAMQSAAYVNLTDASRDQGVSPELMLPMGALLARAVARAKGAGDIADLAELLRLDTTEENESNDSNDSNDSNEEARR
jgi:3-hydroxyisobutyrate dehydrogenase-like beta-hydroxyacid dehydrogenase